MKIDKAKARVVLEEAVRTATSGHADKQMLVLVQRLSDECSVNNKTFLAALGTALLARATHLEIDPFALKSGLDTPGAYSARSLCQHVLAAHAPRLGIDLGVTGREPLNNQPFFAKDKISKALPVKGNARGALDLLLEALKHIKAYDTENKAKQGLRAYTRLRRRQKAKGLASGAGKQLSLAAFIDLIPRFVEADGEYGRRAQAVAAGMMDVLTSKDRVSVGRVNDPDRRFPGDVGIRKVADEPQLERAIEVRDKSVQEEDLYHFVQKASDNDVTKAIMLAVSPHQKEFNSTMATSWAADRSVMLAIYIGWDWFVTDALMYSPIPYPEVVEEAYRAIYERALEIEVSEPGLAIWRKAGQGFE